MRNKRYSNHPLEIKTVIQNVLPLQVLNGMSRPRDRGSGGESGRGEREEKGGEREGADQINSF